ncbi:MAG: 2-oxoglutarate dehydrogenase E1 subunit family protein, partial [Actinomycetota bacterium]
MADIADRTQDFGANSWLVEEMYEQFRNDPASVSEAWREFFSDYRSMTNGGAPAPATPPAMTPAPASNGSANGAATCPFDAVD